MRTYTALALVVCVGSPLAAQGKSGRIEGQITDSVHVSPLADALVTATRIGTARDTTYFARTDRRGRYSFQSLDSGRYAMRFVSGPDSSCSRISPRRLCVVVMIDFSRLRTAIIRFSLYQRGTAAGANGV